MKKILGVFLFALAASSAHGAETCSKSEPSRPQGALPACIALDAVTSTGSSATIDTFAHRNLGVQIFSASGSVATLSVDCRSYTNAPWFPCVNGGVVNPDANGVYISLPRAYQYRVNVSAYTSGTITANFERYNQ